MTREEEIVFVQKTIEHPAGFSLHYLVYYLFIAMKNRHGKLNTIAAGRKSGIRNVKHPKKQHVYLLNGDMN